MQYKTQYRNPYFPCSFQLLQLLLDSQVVGMSTFLLSAVLGTRMQPCITLTTDHLIAIILLCQQSQTGFNNTTTQTQHQMQSRLLLNIVVRKSSPIFQLFSSKNQTLLVWRNSFLILDLGFNIVDGVTGFNLKGDGLTSQCFHKDLHVGTFALHLISVTICSLIFFICLHCRWCHW